MLFHAQHDVLKVQRGNVTSSVRILQLKSFKRALFVKVMQELRELRVVNGARSVSSEIKLRERSIEFVGNFLVELGLLNHRSELSCKWNKVNERNSSHKYETYKS